MITKDVIYLSSPVVLFQSPATFHLVYNSLPDMQLRIEAPDIVSGDAVFRNDTREDSIFLFKDRVLSSIGNWQNCKAESADFDGDGDKDVLITGETGGINIITARLYFNNGNGTFTASTQTFPPATQGDLKLLD